MPTLYQINAVLLCVGVIIVVAVIVCFVALPIGHARGSLFRRMQLHHAGARGDIDKVPQPTRNDTRDDAATTGKVLECYSAPLRCTGRLSDSTTMDGGGVANTANARALRQCMLSSDRGWCERRNGDGKSACVPGQLTGPDDPARRCQNWWYQGMCLVGPECRKHALVPPPAMLRDDYHHPAPYYYRNYPWSSGSWAAYDRRYQDVATVAFHNTVEGPTTHAPAPTAATVPTSTHSSVYDASTSYNPYESFGLHGTRELRPCALESVGASAGCDGVERTVSSRALSPTSSYYQRALRRGDADEA